MHFRISAVLAFLLVSATLAAVPARPGIHTYTQPDGTSFQVTLTGDEFFKLARTTDGSAVIKDDDGYYSYALYDQEGLIHSTGVHVSRANSASAAAASARNIPYGALSRLNASMRGLAGSRSVDADRNATRTKSGKILKKALIIPAQFSDLSFRYGRQYFVDMLTKKGYSYEGASGSALDYFEDQLGEAYEFEFDVTEVVTLSRGYAYYGKNDSSGKDAKAHEAVAEACRLVDRSVDFSEYDTDGDGEVDNVFVFVPGKDEAEGAGADHIWSHQWYLESGAGYRLQLDGKKINSYAISTEISHDWDTGKDMFTSIGTFCHEYSHVLGLRDAYDTDYASSGGTSDALWRHTSLMDGGSYNNNGRTPPNYNAFELESLGVGLEEKLSEGNWVLSPIGVEKRYLRLDGKNPDEYFLVECRASTGWDSSIGGNGLLIYHIDKSQNDAGVSDYLGQVISAADRFRVNEVNCRPDHQCIDLIEAHEDADNVYQVFWPYERINSLSPDTRRDFRFWGGHRPEVSFFNIKRYYTGEVHFTVAGSLAFEKTDIFQDAAIIQWRMTSAEEGAPNWVKVTDGRKSTEYEVKPYETGRYSLTLEGLKENWEYRVLVIGEKGGTGPSITMDFTTKSYYSNGYPFIYLNSAMRYSDGSFVKGSAMPLKIYNARNMAEVEWLFNSERIQADGSGYWTVNMDGTLKAVVHYKDGGRDVIMKKITVK